MLNIIMKKQVGLVMFLVILAMISNNFELVSAQTENVTSTSTKHNVIDECNVVNATCNECLKNAKCFFCDEDSSCKTLKLSGIFPEGCSASKTRWFFDSCSLDFQALIIGVACSGAFILLLITCCLCYCCNKTCKACGDRSLRRMEKKIMKSREQLKIVNSARKEERQTKNDAIRVKYGLKPKTYAQLDD